MSQEDAKLSSRMRRFAELPKKVTALVEKESDRGAILILAAYVEELLGQIIFESCSSEKLGEELLQFRNPGGDFSSKILLCEAFGFISPDEANAANCLRRVRNNAAHFDPKGRGFDVLFDSPQTAQQIGAFLKFLNLKLTSDKPDGIRKAFVGATRLLATKLAFRIFEARRTVAPKTLKETANAWRARMKDTEIGQIIAAAEQEARDGNPEHLFQIMQATSKTLKLASDHGLAKLEECAKSEDAEQDAQGDAVNRPP